MDPRVRPYKRRSQRLGSKICSLLALKLDLCGTQYTNKVFECPFPAADMLYMGFQDLGVRARVGAAYGVLKSRD
jgi:hypothetical protein